jgi:hypothetical protein
LNKGLTSEVIARAMVMNVGRAPDISDTLPTQTTENPLNERGRWRHLLLNKENMPPGSSRRV